MNKLLSLAILLTFLTGNKSVAEVNGHAHLETENLQLDIDYQNSRLDIDVDVRFAPPIYPINQIFVPVFKDRSNNLFWSRVIRGSYSNGCVDLVNIYRPRRHHDQTNPTDYCTYQVRPPGKMQVLEAHSAAAIACRRMGARLPTQDEYHSLIRQFNHTEEIDGPALTQAGIDEMQYIFRDAYFGNKKTAFWTSTITIGETKNNFARVFYPSDGNLFSGLRSNELDVRCVFGPEGIQNMPERPLN